MTKFCDIINDVLLKIINIKHKKILPLKTEELEHVIHVKKNLIINTKITRK